MVSSCSGVGESVAVSRSPSKSVSGVLTGELGAGVVSFFLPLDCRDRRLACFLDFREFSGMGRGRSPERMEARALISGCAEKLQSMGGVQIFVFNTTISDQLE